MWSWRKPKDPPSLKVDVGFVTNGFWKPSEQPNKMPSIWEGGGPTKSLPQDHHRPGLDVGTVRPLSWPRSNVENGQTPGYLFLPEDTFTSSEVFREQASWNPRNSSDMHQESSANNCSINPIPSLHRPAVDPSVVQASWYQMKRRVMLYQVNSLSTELAFMKQEIEGLTRLNRQSLVDQGSKSQGHSADEKEFLHQLYEEQSKNQQLRKLLQVSEAARQDLNRQIHANAETQGKLNAELEAMRQSRATLEDQLHDALRNLKEIDALVSQGRQHQAATSQLSKHGQGETDSLSRAKHDHSTLLALVRESNVQKAASDTQLAQLHAETCEMRETIRDLQVQNDMLNEEVIQLRGEVDHLSCHPTKVHTTKEETADRPHSTTARSDGGAQTSTHVERERGERAVHDGPTHHHHHASEAPSSHAAAHFLPARASEASQPYAAAATALPPLSEAQASRPSLPFPKPQPLFASGLDHHRQAHNGDQWQHADRIRHSHQKVGSAEQGQQVHPIGGTTLHSPSLQQQGADTSAYTGAVAAATDRYTTPVSVKLVSNVRSCHRDNSLLRSIGSMSLVVHVTRDAALRDGDTVTIHTEMLYCDVSDGVPQPLVVVTAATDDGRPLCLKLRRVLRTSHGKCSAHKEIDSMLLLEGAPDARRLFPRLLFYCTLEEPLSEGRRVWSGLGMTMLSCTVPISLTPKNRALVVYLVRPPHHPPEFFLERLHCFDQGSTLSVRPFSNSPSSHSCTHAQRTYARARAHTHTHTHTHTHKGLHARPDGQTQGRSHTHTH